MSRLDFDKINAAALAVLPALVTRLLPDGYREGDEWYALNPHRPDRHEGSFKINLRTGHWADFALPNVRGRDVIGFVAYVTAKTRVEAARALAHMLGLS
ncbi:hypothetical protein [Aestuariivirga sp.]|uniref:hypothetical protein n=1 Tax=Aestuariivirga sp. TaxID=2650926 RepID=UPI00391CC8D9